MSTSKIIITIIVLGVVAVAAYSLGKKPVDTVSPTDISAVTQDTKPVDIPKDNTPPPVDTAPAISFESGQCPGFIVSSPVAGDTVTFPLTISGTIHPTSNPGPWIVFEGEAGTVVVKDANNTPQSDTKIMTLSVDWMNSNPKPFSVTIPTLTGTPNSNELDIIFTDNNPSGDGNYHTCTLGVTL